MWGKWNTFTILLRGSTTKGYSLVIKSTGEQNELVGEDRLVNLFPPPSLSPPPLTTTTSRQEAEGTDYTRIYIYIFKFKKSCSEAENHHPPLHAGLRVKTTKIRTKIVILQSDGHLKAMQAVQALQAQQIAQVVAQPGLKLGQAGLTARRELGQTGCCCSNRTGKGERAGLAAGQAQLTPQQVGEGQLVLLVVVVGVIKTKEVVKLGLEEGLMRGVQG